MAKKLIIVESPNKVSKIQSFFAGKDFKVIASVGHIRDLKKYGTKLRLGINLDDMEPIYENIKDKKEVIKIINDEAKKADVIYIATDPDREGEAIGWHIAEVIGNNKEKVKRIYFNEITKNAVLNSLKEPTKLNMSLVDSQETRRMLDRIIGFRLSFLTQKKLSAPSAGRVKSSTLKLIIDRENEIKNFKPDYWWTIEAEKEKNNIFYNATREFKIIQYPKKETAENVLKLVGENFLLIDKKETSKTIPSPFPLEMASYLMAMFNNYGISNNQATFIAQTLYEKGLITYPRTDSTRISSVDFIQKTKKRIIDKYGEEYYQGVKIASKKNNDNAQDAHEAIRPTNIDLDIDKIKGLNSQEKKGYNLILNITLKSFMKNGVNSTLNLLYENNNNYFINKITKKVFLGYRIVDGKEDEKETKVFEKVKIKKEKIKVVDHQTTPPPRYNQASIIKKLKTEGIGRPSTYSTTTSGLINYNYLKKENNYLVPTEIAFKVNQLLLSQFKDIINEKYTAGMEDILDKISNGDEKGRKYLKSFWNFFEPRVEEADKTIEGKKVELVGRKCPDCGGELVYKSSRYGKFIGCSNFPKCKYVEKIENEKAKKEKPQVINLEEKCPKSGHNLVIRKSRYNTYFIGCSNFPKCKYIMEKEKAKKIIEKYLPKDKQ